MKGKGLGIMVVMRVVVLALGLLGAFVAWSEPIDVMAPQLGEVTHVVEQDGSVTVRANVSDDVAVATVLLFFRSRAADAWQQTVMTPTGAGYQATLAAALIHSQQLQFYLEAMDTIGNQVSNASATNPKVLALNRLPPRKPESSQAKAESGFSWWWVVGGVLLAVIIYEPTPPPAAEGTFELTAPLPQ